MRILHTGDWHIGKIVNGVHMTKDQEYILEKLIQIIKEEKPDIIVIAGDLYDRSIPPVDAVELLDATFSKILLELKVPILAIAGNHDSADRVSFANKILRDKGLYIEGKYNGTAAKVTLKDEYGPLNFYLIPYSDPAEVRETLRDEGIKTHDDAMKAIINRIELDTSERNVAVVHGYITGAEALEQSDSERPLSIGGTDFVDVNYLSSFNYVAMGHLHGNQKVSKEYIRYSGSILKYSFSEVNHKKGVTIVDLDGSGSAKISFKELVPLRDMRRIKGELSKLLDPNIYKDTNVQDYLHVVLTDEGELIDPINKLREVYPNVLSLERFDRKKNSEITRTSAGISVKEKSKLELFRTFYTNITGNEFLEEKEEIIKAVIEEVEKGER